MMKGEYSSIGVKEVPDPRRFGVAETKNGFITTLIEKPENPTSNLAIVGLYFIKHPDILLECLKEMIKNDVRTKGEFQLTDGLQMMIERGEKIKTFTIDGWFDCGKPETLLETNKHLLSQNSTHTSPQDVVVIPPVFISPKAIVKNSVIGPNATIAAGAIVENSIVRNSIISEDAAVQSALLEESIIGSNAIVKGGYKKINIGDSSELEFY
jgi:glucose-1-phosphate thymidylyltransferase